jgi:hypothetical protein
MIVIAEARVPKNITALSNVTAEIRPPAFANLKT